MALIGATGRYLDHKNIEKLYGFKEHTFGKKSTPVEVEVQVVLFFLEDKQKVGFSCSMISFPSGQGLQRRWFQEERCQHREPGMA